MTEHETQYYPQGELNMREGTYALARMDSTYIRDSTTEVIQRLRDCMREKRRVADYRNRALQ